MFNALANNIGVELCEIYVVPTVASFAEDSSSKVRRALASNFLNMCRSITKELFSKKMIPVYEKLSQDSLWIVRKIACLSIHHIAEICTPDNLGKLLQIYKCYTEDSQKFVKNSALEVVGYFTDVLPKDSKLNVRFILDFYVKTVESLYQSNQVATQADNETLYNCAFNFPAVLLFFGKESWLELRPIYIKMTADKYFKVRKSLASSINEVANIIGKKDTEQYLIPIFDRFYREEGEIQRAIYKTMPQFLLNVNENKRIGYLEKLRKMITGREKWRTKKECVDILGNLGGVFDDDVAYEQIFPICVKLCVDEVAEVRMHAAKSIKSLVVQFLKDTKHREFVLEIIKSFAMSLKYIYRNQYICLIQEMVNEKELVETYFMEYIEFLSRDKVENIKYNLCKLVQAMINTKLYTDNKIFRIIYLRVINYKSKFVNEVSSTLTKDVFKFESVEEEKSILEYENSNSLFNNRMEILKDHKIATFIPGLTVSQNKYLKENKSNSSIIQKPKITELANEEKISVESNCTSQSNTSDKIESEESISNTSVDKDSEQSIISTDSVIDSAEGN